MTETDEARISCQESDTMNPNSLFCGTCKFQIEERCRLLPPHVILRMMPKLSDGGLILGSDSPNGNVVEVVPTLSSVYPPVGDQMPACFQYTPRENNGQLPNQSRVLESQDG